jgi:hypothetical protein
MLNRLPSIFLCFVLTAQLALPQPARLIDYDLLLPGSAGEPVTDAPPMPFPARGGEVDWGVALSGGGLRSAAFSIGTMKALYDLGLLDDVDVISSVSGGGYASYWLYSRYDGRDATRFGAGAFEEKAFPRNVCTLARKSKFFPLNRMIAAVFSPRDKAFRKYRDAIEWSFGFEDGRTRAEKSEAGDAAMRTLQSLDSQIARGAAPYFILNTTIDDDRTRTRSIVNQIEKTFEIGPTYRGSSLLSFANWPSGDSSIKTWCDGVAMSAAALRFKLSRRIPNYSPELLGTRIDLADGGFSENLAALPLIERRIKNIVIVDAENDPGYTFESYSKLKTYLKSRQIDLTVAQIDAFLALKKRPTKTFTDAAVANGIVKFEDASESKIYYIKMSRPASIFPPELRGQKSGQEMQAHRSKSRPASCSVDALEPITRESLRREMLSYSRFLNKKWFWRHIVGILPYINYNFPQITTIDQTFYSDQLEAFIGLGYLEGCEMEAFARTGKKCR